MHWLDPDYLPETVGTVGRFLINPDDLIDGLLLADGTEIHIPPHMDEAVRQACHPGDAISVRGVRPRGADVIAAVAIDTAAGRLRDDGPPEDNAAKKHAKKNADERRTKMKIEGRVRRGLHGPKGELRKLLLDEGAIGRFPPEAAHMLRPLIEDGAPIVVRGDGLTTAAGTVIKVREMGPSRERLHPVKPPPKH
jgi:hypothetical protein